MADQRVADDRLHLYFDGELSPEEASEVRRRVEGEPELQAKLAGLREVRAVVRASVAEGVDEVPSDDLWAAIEARIGGEEARPQPALRSIAGGRAGARALGRDTEDAVRDETPRGGAPDPQGGRRWIGVAIAGLALAAAVLLLVLRPGEPSGTVDPGALAAGGGGAAGPGARPGAGEIVFQTEVLEVDFGSNSGAVFAVEGDHGERYAVVWLADVQPKPGSGAER